MNVIWKAACAAALIAAAVIELGCGDVYRPISNPLPVTNGNPAGPETEVVLNLCPTGSVCLDNTGAPSGSVLTDINVSGDTNSGNKPLYNTVASQVGPAPGSLASPMGFTALRTSVFTANPATDSVSQASLGTSTAGFSANTTTISLPTGSAPTGISFQYFGTVYTQDYVVDAGTNLGPLAAAWEQTCPTGVGAVSAILQATDQLAATVCVGATPVDAWIYHDQSKVFVLDYTEDQVYVVNASKYQVTNKIKKGVGVGPFKAAQSNTGQYIYVLNSDDSISIIDGLSETVVQTVQLGTLCADCDAQPVDIAMDPNFNDTSTNTQINHVWVLHNDGTVSVWDGTTPGTLTWITAVATITPAQASAGAYPTNLALMRDGTYAYVGVGNTDQMVAINTSLLASPGSVTPGVNSAAGPFVATTPITVGMHRSVEVTLTNNLTGTPVAGNVLVENTTPTVNSVAVSREGSTADLSKAYATTTTNTIYYCYDQNVNPKLTPQVEPTDCMNPDPWVYGTPITARPPAIPFLVAGCTDIGLIGSGAGAGLYGMSCPGLYNGTTVVAAAANGTTLINSYVTTLPAPSLVTYCNPGNPATGVYDGQKYCPAMTPVLVLGRN